MVKLEQEKRKEAQDQLIRMSKETVKLQNMIAKYEALLKDTTSDKAKIMKKEFDVGRGGSRRWPVWVVQFVCELLVCGTLPRTIRNNLVIMYRTMYDKETSIEVLSLSFIRECRTIVQVVGETVTAIKLGQAEKWDQLWTDATSRRQISFQTLIIGMLGDDDIVDPFVVSSRYLGYSTHY